MATTTFSEHTDGRFLFARQAMLLVELASAVARRDPPTFRRFSEELRDREGLLFKRIPYRPGRGTTDAIPRIAPRGNPTSELIALLFDLVRNGHAHWGHQLYAPLKDGRAFGVVLVAGAANGRTIDKIRPSGGRTLEHLACYKQPDGNIAIRLCPGTLYLDVRDASESAGVWELEADASDFTAARAQDITVDELEAALVETSGPYMLMFEHVWSRAGSIPIAGRRRRPVGAGAAAARGKHGMNPTVRAI